MRHIKLQFRFVQDLFLESLFYAKCCAVHDSYKSDEDIIHGWEDLMVSVGSQDMEHGW